MKKNPKKEINLNMTSMMDVTFQLIIFFILVTNFAAADLPEMEIPEPFETRAKVVKDQNRIIINLIYDADKDMREAILIGGEPYTLVQMKNLLIREHEADPEVQVALRADRQLSYDQVSDVLLALSQSQIVKLQLVAKHNE